MLRSEAWTPFNRKLVNLMSSTHPQRMRGILAIAFALATIVLIAQPARADFTPPNMPKLTKSVEITAPTGAVTSFFDNENGVVHVIGAKTLTTYNATTLAVVASLSLNIDNDEFFRTDGNAFDPEHSMIFATVEFEGVKKLMGYQYTPGEPEYPGFDINIPSQNTVIYSSALDRVYSIATGENVEPVVARADRDAGGIWTAGPSYPSIDIGGGNTGVSDIAATTDGTLIGTYPTTGSGSGPDDIQIDRKPIYSFFDTGDALIPTEIPGTQLDPITIPYPTSSPVGYGDLTPLPNGSMSATEINFNASSRQMITLDPSVANPSGFIVNATTLALPLQPKFTSYDLTGDLYVSSADTLSMYGDGLPIASSDAFPDVRGMTGGDERVYAFTGASSPYNFAAFTIGAYSPTIATDPTLQNITVTGSETKPVTFQSAGTGIPTPTARWQKQLAGESVWNDIVGATSSDLTFNAGAADNGNRYRAIYTNIAGEIDTASAQLNVTVNTPVILPVIPILPIELPAPAAVQAKNGKSVKLKYKKGKSVRVTVGTVTCASVTTCVYTLPKSIKFKIGKKSFKASVKGPASLEPGKSQAIYATVPAAAIKALKGKKSKLTVSVKVANTAGRMHDMAKSIISKISA